MRFTERELTAAVQGAAKTVLAARRDVRRGRVDVEEAWRALSGGERYAIIAPVGDQVLPVLLALPDVEVEAGTRPTFTDAQVREAVEAQVDAEPGGRLRRAALVTARTLLVRAALESVPPRQDPDALIVPDHL